MDSIDRVKDFLRWRNPSILPHAWSTMQMAKELADRWSVDAKRVCVVALLHDCVKDIKGLKSMISNYNVKLDRIERELPCLWHAAAAEAIAKVEFGIEDEEMLSAIRWHSTSCKGMGMLGKILYVSDYAESGRVGKEHIRRVSFKDIELAFLLVMDEKISHLIKEGKLIHPRLLVARNHTLQSRRCA
jgi:predicted HD superfamily hydrolase involved in NAD metabolism